VSSIARSASLTIDHHRPKSTGSETGSEKNAEYDPFRDFSAALGAEASHTTVSLLPVAASSTLSANLFSHPPGIPTMGNIRSQPAISDGVDRDLSEEGALMVEEISRGDIMEDFEFGLRFKSALTQESNSSEFSGRTWNSSIGSNPATSGITLFSTTSTLSIPKAPSMQEAAAVREFLGLSSIDGNTDYSEDRLESDLATTSSTEVTSMVKKEQSSKKTEGQGSGDLLAVSSVPLSIATLSTEFRRKIVIVGDASCEKKALLM
jgi:hypothetical protein